MIRKAEYYRASGRPGNKKWSRYALIFLFVSASAFVLQFVLRQLLFYPLRVDSDSMQPEIQRGDKRYFVYPKLTTVVKGDIVLVNSIAATVQYLCRVVAIDGDKVKINEGQLIVNSKAERQLNPRLKLEQDRSFFLAEVEVRPNYFFCMNDNDRNSDDSRQHGIFERRQIAAKLIRPKAFF